MIPVKLTIEGLYSYQKQQTIDFTRLTASHIFGIFGQVGSGKSTILEAISFALFDDTERMNKTDGRAYNMMNLKSNKLYLEFQFVSGVTHKLYKVIVNGSRNRNNYQAVTITRKAYVIENDIEMPIDEKRTIEVLQHAIGINYNNFKRTIIIPQGKFQEFLQLGSKDRTTMMKELFGLEKYDLFRKAASLDKRNNERKQFLEGQLSTLGDVAPEQIEALQELQQQHQQVVQVITANLEAKHKELGELQRLKELSVKRTRLLGEQQLLNNKAESIQQQEDMLREYEYCLVHFKGLMEQEAQLKKNVGMLEEQLSVERSTLHGINKNIDEKVLLLEQQQPQYDRRDLLAEEVEDLRKLAEIRRAEKEIEEKQVRIANGADAIAKKQQEVEALGKNLDATTTMLRELKASLPDGAQLAAAREWYATQKSIAKQLLEAEAELDNLKRVVNSQNEAFAQLIVTEGLAVDGHQPSLQEAAALLAAVVDKSQQAIREKENEIEHLRVQQKLGQYADALHDGEPCPLCGSQHHPQKLDIEDVDGALGAAKKAKDRLEETINRCRLADKRLTEVQFALKAAGESLALASAKHAKLSADGAVHQSLFRWSTYPTEEALLAAVASSEKLSAEIKNAEAEQDRLAISLKQEGVNLDKFQKGVDAIKLEIATLEGQRKSLIEGLLQLSASSHTDFNSEGLAAAANEKSIWLKTLVTSYEALANEIHNLKVQQASRRGTVETLAASLAKEQQVHQQAVEAIAHKLTASGRTSVEEVKATLAQSVDVDATREVINQHRQALQTVSVQLLEVERDFGGKSYSSEQHAQVDQEVADLSEREAVLRKEMGRVESEISAKKMALKQIANIRKELNVVNLRASELTTLKSLLQGNKFIDFVSTTYLQNLCAAANERFFKMTRQRLSLELTHDNNFLVRDYMNGGKTRSVKTLSGGQTFQASLSLALALSDNIQRMQSADQNFFFLDEGFGTLDKESLGVVFETLKSLRKENRIVGVISHVDEMQQEIDTHLRVVNYEDTGSVVFPSWE